MKKLLIFILCIFLFNVSNIYALNQNFEINSIEITDKSNSISVSNPSITDNSISSNIEFNEVSDFVKYKIVLKNNTDKEYRIKDIINNYNGEYIDIFYEYSNDIIKKNDIFDFYITIKYVDEVYINDLVYNLDDFSINLNLEEVESNNEVIIDINPNTIDNIYKYVIILIGSGLLVILFLKTKKRIFVLLFISILGISYVYALEEIEITINFSGNIVNIDTNKFESLINEELGITKDNIGNIYFVSSDNIPSNYDGSFDISAFDDEKVIEYYVKNGDVYDIYIASDNGYIKYNSKDLSKLFYGYTNTEVLDLSNFDLSSAENMKYMFYGDTNLKDIIWPDNMDTSDVSDMSYMFAKCENLEDLDVSGFDTSNVTTMKYMFAMVGLEEIDLSNFDTSNVTDMYAMFYKSTSLKYVDTSSFDTSNVTTMRGMFYGDIGLEELDLSNFDTSNVENLSYVFYNCEGLTSLNVSSFDTSKATDLSYMFGNCHNLTSLDVSNFDTSNVENLSYTFYNLRNLTTLDVSNFDTSNVTNFDSTFRDCRGLETIDLSNFDTSSATLIRGMFYDCTSLKSIDLSNFDTTNMKDISWLFRGCTSLESINFGDFETGGITDMNHMFTYCSSLKNIDLTNFDTKNVTSLNGLFYGCTSLEEIDLSNFDTRSVTDMTNMFGYCTKLNKIYASELFVTDLVESSNNMFKGSTLIVGGNGTTYNSSFLNKTYARIDTTELPGYFTQK